MPKEKPFWFRGKRKQVFEALALLLVLLALLSGCQSEQAETTEGENRVENSYEMTEEQKELLIKISVNEERVQDGKLYSWQIEVLHQYDYAMEYLKAKYPSHSFAITNCQQANKLNAYTTFWFQADGETEFWELQMDVTEDEETGESAYRAMDNFYSSLLTPEYEKLLLEIVQESVPACYAVNCTMTEIQGEAFDEALTAEQLLSSGQHVRNQVVIYLDGTGMEDWQALCEQISSMIQERHIYGFYTVYVTDGALHDLTTEKVAAYVKENGYLYKLSFNAFL